MGIEMGIGRLLTPYFGSSIYIGTNLMVVILLCLAIGYNCSAYITNNNKVIYRLILSAGIYYSCIPFFAPAVLQHMTSWTTFFPLGILLVSFLSNLLLIGAPFVFIGLVLPYLLTVRSSYQKLGKIIGQRLIFLTIGSIVGTCIAVFFSIPFLGTKYTIFYFGLLLVATSIIELLRINLKK